MKAWMRSKRTLTRFIPQSLGGREDNIWNDIFYRLFSKKDCSASLELQGKTLPQTRFPLWNYIQTHRCKNILEIGLGSGKNMEKMMELAGDGCDYYCFDNLIRPESKLAFQKLRSKKNIHFYIGDTWKTLPNAINGLPKMDVIHIDGGHDYPTVKRDWKNCKWLMYSETVVFFHDYNVEGVKNVVDEMGDDFTVEIIDPGIGPLFALVKISEKKEQGRE